MGFHASARLIYGFKFDEDADSVLDDDVFMDDINEVFVCFVLLRDGLVSSVNEYLALSDERRFELAEEVFEKVQALPFEADFFSEEGRSKYGLEGLVFGLKKPGAETYGCVPVSVNAFDIQDPDDSEVQELMEFRERIGFETTMGYPCWLLGASYG